MRSESSSRRRYRGLFLAAGSNNLIWGGAVVLFPYATAELAGLDPAVNLAIWQAIGMLVLVYAPAYWWLATDPDRFGPFALIALAGKMLGIAGFASSFAVGSLPARFGLVILTNDVIWLPGLALFVRASVSAAGGWRRLLVGRLGETRIAAR